MKLSVPLVKGKHEGQSIREVRISYEEPWQKVHWQSIRSAYGRAPFFEHYAFEIKTALMKSHVYLFDLNKVLIECICELLDWPWTYSLTSEFKRSGMDEQRIYRDAIRTHGSLNVFEKGMEACIQHYESVHDNPEKIRTSILDLLFYTGPESRLLLHKYIPTDG